MFRKVLELSSRNSAGKSILRKRKPLYLSSRRQFSTASPGNAPPKPGPASKPPEPGNSFPKVVIGGIAAVGVAFLAARQAGYLEDQTVHEEKHDAQATVGLDVEDRSIGMEEPKASSRESQEEVLSDTDVREAIPIKDNAEGNVETHPVAITSEEPHERHNVVQPLAQDKSEARPSEIEVKGEEKLHPSLNASDDHSIAPVTSEDGYVVKEGMDATISAQLSEKSQVSHMPSDGDSTSPDSKYESPVQGILEEEQKEDIPGLVETTPLLDSYHLHDKNDEKISVHINDHDKENAFDGAMGELGEAATSKDGKLILDFLQAIHAAEIRQAELDARTFNEEKKALKEKYEKELKDAIARELMHAEEAALLDKELKRERVKAAAALKSLQQKLEEMHKMELEEKEKEAELKLQKVEELSKADMSATIAREKASLIEKMAEANLHINALCMAFYARSEEARQSHSIHKLALGALALEDALSKGLPIKAEIEALRTYLHGIEKDSVLDLVLTSLPEETIDSGTDTVLQLNQQFHTLKGTLRHFSLIPPGGGGILAHSLARIASWLKVREASRSGNGIDALIFQVESYLAEGKLAEAADALEEGVKGSEAAEIINSWVKQARNRAIAEQALTLLQSYATAVSLT